MARLNRLAGITSQFLEQQIDFSVLGVLTDQDLKDLGVSLLGHRRKLMLAITNMGAEEGTRGKADLRRGCASITACGDAGSRSREDASTVAE